jgi:hypothetical protein
MPRIVPSPSALDCSPTLGGKPRPGFALGRKGPARSQHLWQGESSGLAGVRLAGTPVSVAPGVAQEADSPPVLLPGSQTPASPRAFREERRKKPASGEAGFMGALSGVRGPARPSGGQGDLLSRRCGRQRDVSTRRGLPGRKGPARSPHTSGRARFAGLAGSGRRAATGLAPSRRGDKKPIFVACPALLGQTPASPRHPLSRKGRGTRSSGSLRGSERGAGEGSRDALPGIAGAGSRRWVPESGTASAHICPDRRGRRVQNVRLSVAPQRPFRP